MKRLGALLLVVFAAAACGGSKGTAKPQGEQLTVYAAVSLSHILPSLDRSIHYEFSGSSTLAIAIEHGAAADVFVSATPKYLLDLKAKRLLLEPPEWFATNRLVLIVPRMRRTRVHTVDDLVQPGVRLAIAQRGLPAGTYARRALAALHLEGALQNVDGEETSVHAVVDKVTSGKADAGFVYSSDARAADEQVRVIPMPRAGRQMAVYGVGVMRHSPHSQLGRGFVALLLSPPAQDQLRDAGFGPPPAHK